MKRNTYIAVKPIRREIVRVFVTTGHVVRACIVTFFRSLFRKKVWTASVEVLGGETFDSAGCARARICVAVCYLKYSGV